MSSFEEEKTSTLKKAAKKIVELKEELSRLKNTDQGEPLAVIGMGCTFPGGANTPALFWQRLLDGYDGICSVPADRWDADAYFSRDTTAPGKINSKKGGFIDIDVANFDACFFGISPKEASSMDPQQRLLLEVMWQALENAAINPQALKETDASVYIGSSLNDYQLLLNKEKHEKNLDAYMATGNSSSVMAGRIAYILGLQGPALACDTACSSSLVAVHLACRALRNRETSLAIVGGVSLILTPNNSIIFSKANMLCEDGHCKTFDEKADGYVRGEGCGVVIIKRLSDALRDSDNILAVIKGTAINQDGASGGLTVPSVSAQEKVIRLALSDAMLAPKDIDLIEAHGTGTALGDPIEVQSISHVFKRRENDLVLGSAKVNIGHLEGAAGVAGLIKTILSLQYEQIPKHRNFKTLNPMINLAEFNGVIPLENRAWKRSNQRVRRAGVSSFGFSGTNAHVVIEEAPILLPTPMERRSQYLFCFSAKTETALRRYLQTFVAFLTDETMARLSAAQVSYTLNTGRAQFKQRAAFIAESLQHLKASIVKGDSFKSAISQPANEAMAIPLEERLAAFFLMGEQTEFSPLYPTALNKVQLPTYAFDHSRYWENSKKLMSTQLDNIEFFDMQWQVADKVAIQSFENKHMVMCEHDLSVLAHITQQEWQRIDGIIILATKACTHWVHLFRVIQNLIAIKRALPLGMAIVTKGALPAPNRQAKHEATESNAILTGLVKSLDWEAPFLNARLIDVDEISVVKTFKEKLPWFPTPLVALSNQTWYIPSVKNITPQDIAKEQPFNPEGTHWITGGTGSLGLALASELINLGVCSLLISSRHGETAAVKQWLKQYDHHAVRIRVVSVDVTDKAALEKAIWVEIPSDKPLKGIYHLAGVNVQKSMVEWDWQEVKKTMSAKLKGAMNIHTLTVNMDLNYFVLFSSIASFVGSNRQMPYVMANGYLDSLAKQRQDNKQPCLLINWGPWSHSSMTQNHLGNAGLIPVTTGLSCFTQLIQSTCTEAAVIHPQFIPFMFSFYPDPHATWLGEFLPYVDTQDAILQESTVVEKLRALSVKDRRQQLINLVSEAVKQALELSLNPSRTEGFFELGMDSLMSVDMGRKIQKYLGVKLKPTAAFDYPNINAMVEYLESLLINEQANDGASSSKRTSQGSISIVGMSCCFPGDARDLDAFWECLYLGKDCISDTPKSRFDLEAHLCDEQLECKASLSNKGGFIHDIDLFDAEFFNISPREAESLDPQQRLILEHSWIALEQAGINPKKLRGKAVGIFVGISQSEYASFVLKNEKQKGAYHATGSALNAAAGRLGYFLGTEGPTMAIDTACSSSLVALHEACNSLRQGDCELAIVAGVNAIIDPNIFITLANAEMLSPDGACKTFDVSANGYVRGEGCGVVILRRTEDLQLDDISLASILASHANQDGASSGLTVPNSTAQKNLLRQVLTKANLSPDDIDYIETHGSGTSLGDPIEVGALSDVFAGRKRPLVIGTVKTNIGHLESASGIAGVIKTVLLLHHRYIPRHLHFERINPHIDLSAIPATIPTEGLTLPSDSGKHRAGVSSFGFSGSNAHVILEEAASRDLQRPAELSAYERLFVLSARSKSALKGLIARYMSYLQQTDALLIDICYTAATGRAHFPYRIALKTTSIHDLVSQLSSIKIVAPSYRDDSDAEIVADLNIDTLQEAYLAGHSVDWDFLYKPLSGMLRKVSLPSYYFDKKRYWCEACIEKPLQAPNIHPLLVNQAYSHHHKEHLFTTPVSVRYPSFVNDHKIYGLPVIAGATYISMVVSFVLQVLEHSGGVIQQLVFTQPLIVDKDNPRTLQLIVKETGKHESSFEVLSYKGKVPESYISHAQGVIQLTVWNLAASPISIDHLRQRLNKRYDGSNHQQKVANAQLHVGPHFHWIENIHHTETELLAKMRLPTATEKNGYNLYPGFIDASFQTMMAWVDFDPSKATLHIPVSIDKITFKSTEQLPRYVYMQREEGSRRANIHYLDAMGHEVLSMETFTGREVSKATFLKILNLQYEYYAPTYFVDWHRASDSAIPVAAVIPDEIELLMMCSAPPSHGLTEGSSDTDGVASLIQALSPLVVTLIDTPSDKHLGKAQHVLYMYPANSDSQPMEAMYQLHQQVQVLLGNLAIKSIGVVINRSLAHSPVTGYWRTLALECPEKNIYMIESKIIGDERLLSNAIKAHCLGQVEERHLAIRNAMYFVPRLLNQSAFEAKNPSLLHPVGHQILTCENQLLDSLAWQEEAPTVLAENQVRIAIKMTSLHFRDVLKLMGTYPGRHDWHFFEHAGVVTDVGPLVKGIQVGDRVITLAEKTFCSESYMDANSVWKVPSHLSLQQACSIPGVFLTAYGCLYELADIQQHDRVLIHSASGGVGLAAIQLAKLRGATLFVTTSHAKRAYLESLGITHIYDSRSANFAESILQDTNGDGVSVVLNSLTSEGFIEETLRALQHGGTFVEIGKLNIYSPEQMAAVRPDVNYHIYALDERMTLEPKKTSRQLKKIFKLHEQGKCQPLINTVFDVRQVTDAFRYLQSGRHLGKVLVNHSKPFRYCHDKTYLITGGLGGLGQHLIKHLIQKGVKHIAIMGRRKITSLDTYLGHLMSDDVCIQYHAVDVCDESTVVEAMGNINTTPQPLAGIFHLAGLLHDRTIANLTRDDFDNAFKTKLLGSLALHHASEQLDLDCFVMFSSITAVFGAPGQANYAAANAFMDELAHQRMRAGLPALSINWGPFAEAGMAKEHVKQYQQKGLHPLNWNSAFNAMDGLLERPFYRGIIADFDWQKASALIQNKAMLSLVHESHKPLKANLFDLLENIAPEQREQVLSTELKKIVASVLYIDDENDIDEHKGFFELGLDSLMSVDVWNRLQSMLNATAKMPKTILFEKNNIYKLRLYLQDEFFTALFSTPESDEDLLINLEALLED